VVQFIDLSGIDTALEGCNDHDNIRVERVADHRDIGRVEHAGGSASRQGLA
jgi:hypothetical protein